MYIDCFLYYPLSDYWNIESYVYQRENVFFYLEKLQFHLVYVKNKIHHTTVSEQEISNKHETGGRIDSKSKQSLGMKTYPQLPIIDKYRSITSCSPWYIVITSNWYLKWIQLQQKLNWETF